MGHGTAAKRTFRSSHPSGVRVPRLERSPRAASAGDLPPVVDEGALEHG